MLFHLRKTKLYCKKARHVRIILDTFNKLFNDTEFIIVFYKHYNALVCISYMSCAMNVNRKYGKHVIKVLKGS